MTPRAYRSHPRPGYSPPSPAAPGQPRSGRSWPRRAGAWGRERDERLRVSRGSPVNTLQQPVGGVGYVRLQSSVGAVDKVPVVDFLQDQQGARLVTLERETPSWGGEGGRRREEENEILVAQTDEERMKSELMAGLTVATRGPMKQHYLADALWDNE